MGCLISCVQKTGGDSGSRADSQPIMWNAPEVQKYVTPDKKTPLEDIMDFLAAFEAGDKNKDGTLNTAEFTRLMVVLGVPGGADRVKTVIKQMKGRDSAVIAQQEYMTAIKRLGVPTTQIRRLKQVFDVFDHDQTGWASKTDVINGLAELGVPIEGELKENLEKLDATNDGKIWFPDFLRVQLNI